MLAALTLRSWIASHTGHCHPLIPRSFRPLGPARLLHTLQVWVENASSTSANHTPASSHLYSKPRQKPPLALEHFHRQFVAIIEHRGDLARQAAKPSGVLVLHPQAQDPNSPDRSRTGHPYSLPKIRQA